MPYASVMTTFGPPEVLQWAETEMPVPGADQIRLNVKAAGISPTDLKIRRGDLRGVFATSGPTVLGFEAAGVVDATGDNVSDVHVGDEVAAWLPGLGGYGEYVVASSWTLKPSSVSWNDAAALPSSGEVAVGVLRQLDISAGETLLILGAAGSAGLIATQLAVADDVRVLAAVSDHDRGLIEQLGATPVRYGASLLDDVRAQNVAIDAVFDSAGRGQLGDAVTLAGGPQRVITIADEHASEFGVRLSAPTPDRAPDGVQKTMQLLADGNLRLRAQRAYPIQDAALAHRELEEGCSSEKLVLVFS